MILPRNFTGWLAVNLSSRLKHWSGMVAFLEKQKDRHLAGFNTKSRVVHCCWMELRMDL